MLNDLHRSLRQLTKPGDTVICALSGGADSVALLFGCCLLKDKLGITLEAAHFNHHLRGPESQRDEQFARQLCDLNRQRQSVESEIYEQAISMLPQGKAPEAIVLAEESWHQGVVGIVASRIAEEYCCPTFLICLDGDHGKASSRSYGGFNLFSALTELSDLLESYGGHELAAGFTISRGNIDRFRQEICAIARDYYALQGGSFKSIGYLMTQYAGGNYQYIVSLTGSDNYVSKSVYDQYNNELVPIAFAPLP